MDMRVTHVPAAGLRSAVALVVGLGLAAVLTGHATVAAQQSGALPGGPHAGIQIHGHWTIEVREPDGTLVTHREFDNALVATGPETLASILSRQRSPGLWEEP